MRDPEPGGGQGGTPTAGEHWGFPECGETGSSFIPHPQSHGPTGAWPTCPTAPAQV